jgi:type IV secretory pathway TraG/TraD family ATPase VirD4
VTATSTRSGGPAGAAETVVVLTIVGVVVLVVGAITAAAHIAVAIGPSPEHLPGNPFDLALGLARGTTRWPRDATVVLGALAVVLLTAVGAGIAGVLWWQGKRSRVDRAARHMGRGRDLAALRRKSAAAHAGRLGVGSPGLPIARAVAGGELLYQGWEDVAVDIWGPRVGKSTARAIPAILEAPGAVLATSNKRDLVDGTRGPRSHRGEVWVFDPQQIVQEPPSWWWNPLSYVVDEVKAAILADVFAAASRDPAARVDAYFEPAAQDLLASLLLAAAAADRALTQVYLWLTDPTEDEPVAILREHGYPLLAAGLQEVVNAPEKQRAGIYGTAKQIAAFMTNRQAMRWVTPDAGVSGAPENPWLREPERREFAPQEFVRGSGTLYSLSKEGRGTAGPLVTALTVAVTEAAEDYAKRSPRGRLPVPLVAVLDEAANVCRWRELPALYSHYGSRGICIMTILQSWSQGVEVWGRDGMRKLWSAANVKVYGGGVAEVEFLSELSQLIGDFDLTTRTVSNGKGGRSTSHATRRERILEVSDLGALPRGRVVVLASGVPPTLARALPWMSGPHAAEVLESIRRYDPGAEETIDSAMRALEPESVTAVEGAL